MADEHAQRAREWLHDWQGIHLSEEAAGTAAGGAHGQVRALDGAVRRLGLDDEAWRLRAVLVRRARR